MQLPIKKMRSWPFTSRPVLSCVSLWSSASGVGRGYITFGWKVVWRPVFRQLLNTWRVSESDTGHSMDTPGSKRKCIIEHFDPAVFWNKQSEATLVRVLMLLCHAHYISCSFQNTMECKICIHHSVFIKHFPLWSVSIEKCLNSVVHYDEQLFKAMLMLHSIERRIVLLWINFQSISIHLWNCCVDAQRKFNFYLLRYSNANALPSYEV